MIKNYEIYTIQNAEICEDIERLGYYRPLLSLCMDAQDNNFYSTRICYRWMIDQLVAKCGMPLGISAEEFQQLQKQDDQAFKKGWHECCDDNGNTSISMDPSVLPHPIWGWQKRYGRKDGKPDMRSWTTNEPEKVVRLRLSIPEDRLLFSDFSYWHIPLNLGYFPSGEDEDFEKLDEAFDIECKKIGLSYGCDLFSQKINHIYTEDENSEIAFLQKKMLDSWSNCLLTPEQLGSVDNPISYRDEKWIDRDTQCVFWEIRKEDILGVEYFTTRKAAFI